MCSPTTVRPLIVTDHTCKDPVWATHEVIDQPSDHAPWEMDCGGLSIPR